MELRRFFRAPLLLIAVAVLLLLFVLDYANSGSSYKQVDTSQIVTAIDQGKVKSALIVRLSCGNTLKSPRGARTFWVRTTSNVSAGQPWCTVKIVTNRG